MPYNADIKNFIPPFLYRAIKSKLTGYGYCGDFKCWEDARAASTGYESASILQRVMEATLKVKTGGAAYERDSVVFEKIEYSWPLLAALMSVAAMNHNNLSVIDFGGSLGSAYYQNRAFFENLDSVNWLIVEQRDFVDCGRKYFGSEQLKFYYDMDSCFEAEKPSTILFSSSIQYIGNPYETIDRAMELGFSHIIFDRMLFFDDRDDRITVQKTDPTIYSASYPCWIFNQAKFIATLERKYRLIASFDALGGEILIDGSRAFHGGLFFRIKNTGERP